MSVPEERVPRVPPRPRYAWLWAAIWLVYASYPAVQAWHEPPLRRAVALTALAGFVVTYVLVFAVTRWYDALPIRRARAFGVGMTGVSLMLAVIIIAALGESNIAVLVYTAAIAVFLLPNRWGAAVLASLLIGAYLCQVLIPGWHVDLSIEFQLLVAGLAMWAVRQIITRNRALAIANEEIARLAAEEERSRISRDLHDILGHSLTVVAVKAELAGRLVRLDPARAEAEIADVEQLARGALTEVRATVAGRHDVTLASELANARTALAAAGIDADLPSAIDDVPAERRELFGFVVREGVTNVVRHSGASRCEVRISPSTVSIVDDGSAPIDALPTNGHGLAGLRARAEAAGGVLQAGRTPEGGFALTMTVPA